MIHLRWTKSNKNNHGLPGSLTASLKGDLVLSFFSGASMISPGASKVWWRMWLPIEYHRAYAEGPWHIEDEVRGDHSADRRFGIFLDQLAHIRLLLARMNMTYLSKQDSSKTLAACKSLSVQRL